MVHSNRQLKIIINHKNIVSLSGSAVTASELYLHVDLVSCTSSMMRNSCISRWFTIGAWLSVIWHGASICCSVYSIITCHNRKDHSENFVTLLLLASSLISSSILIVVGWLYWRSMTISMTRDIGSMTSPKFPRPRPRPPRNPHSPLPSIPEDIALSTFSEYSEIPSDTSATWQARQQASSNNPTASNPQPSNN